MNYSSVTRLAEDCLYSKLQAEVVESLVLEYTSIIDYLVEETFKIKKGTIEEGKGSARVWSKLVIITHRRISLDYYRERRWLSCLLIESARERQARRAGKKGNERNGNRDFFLGKDRKLRKNEKDENSGWSRDGLRRNRRLDLSFPHLLTHDSSYGMDGQRNARRCVVYGLFILSSLSVGKKWRKEVERSQYQRKLFVFKQLYERYLMVEIFLLPFYLG